MHKKIAIVVVDNDWAIGKNNGLLYQLKEDMRYFRENTSGNIVIYGYNTLLSFPGEKPLPKRTNIVVYPDDLDRDDVTVAHTLDEIDVILESIRDDRPAFICGGASIYAQMIDRCDETYITKVDASTPDATVFFPNIDEKPEWSLYEQSDPVKTENGYVIRFCKYRKKN